jgi:hypothetical protein
MSSALSTYVPYGFTSLYSNTRDVVIPATREVYTKARKYVFSLIRKRSGSRLLIAFSFLFDQSPTDVREMRARWSTRLPVHLRPEVPREVLEVCRTCVVVLCHTQLRCQTSVPWLRTAVAAEWLPHSSFLFSITHAQRIERADSSLRMATK